MLMWLKNNPDRMEEAMMEFDWELMKEKNLTLTRSQDIMNQMMYDAVIGNFSATRRKWKHLERQGNQAMGWYPWGTIKKHIQDPKVWGASCDD
eukprot:9060609-Heterocapsa_arctica.AAC.1